MNTAPVATKKPRFICPEQYKAMMTRIDGLAELPYIEEVPC